MEMPQLTEQHKRLAAMAGEWVAAETLHPSLWCPESRTAEGRFTARAALGGFFVIADYQQRREGKITFEGHGVYGYDPKQACYTMHWFDTMGADPGPPVPGAWTGDKLSFQHQHHMGHSRYSYEFDGPDSYTFRLENSQDGESWNLFVEGTYTRVK